MRDDRFCHPELADCELRAELDGKMAKPLQTSIADPLNASNQAVSGFKTEMLKRVQHDEICYTYLLTYFLTYVVSFVVGLESPTYSLLPYLRKLLSALVP